MLTLRIFLRELGVLFVFAAGITAVVELLPAESSLPWTVLLLGVFLGLRTLLRIEASLSEEYRDSLAQRQNLGFLYAAALCAGVGLGVWVSWTWSSSQPVLGVDTVQLAGQFDRRLVEIRGELGSIAEKLHAIEDQTLAVAGAVKELPAKLPRPEPYAGPVARDFQTSQQALREQLVIVNDNIQILEKTIREVSREGRR